jgi:predicted Zn-dependent protease
LGAFAIVTFIAFRRVQSRREAAAVRTAIGARDYAVAERLVNAWLAREPESAEMHFLKGRVALGFGRLPEALQALDRARALGYQEREVQRERAFVLVLAKRYSDAEPILRRLYAETAAPDPQVDEALARVFLQTYKLTAAAQVLDRWKKDAPKDPTPCLWYTEIDHRNRADPAVAIVHYREALERKPDLPQAELGLADELRAAHRYDEAGKAYARYLTRYPTDPAGHIGAGLDALAQNQVGQATEHLDAALALAPDHLDALKERAAVDLRLQRYTDALNRLDRVAEARPFDGETQYRRVILLRRLGRTQDADLAQERLDRLRADSVQLNQLHERLNADPTNNELRCAVASWLLSHGQEAEGIRWAKTVLARAPQHSAANLLLAKYYRNQGNAGLANFYELQASTPTNAAH